MVSLLIEIKQRVDTLKAEGQTEMGSQEIAKYNANYKDIIAKGKLECPILMCEKTGKPKKNAAHRLLARLEKYDIEMLSFMYDFDNPLKITWLKEISGCRSSGRSYFFLDF